MHPSHTLLTLLSISTTALALPTSTSTSTTTRLSTLQCKCLSLSTDPLSPPSLCSALESHTLAWSTASSLASDHDLAIEYASTATITRIRDMERAQLPRNMLASVEHGAVFSADKRPGGLVQVRSVVVCGFGEEMGALGEEEVGEEDEEEDEGRCVGYFGAGIMVLAVGYLVAGHVWARYFARGSIKLEGGEKALTAEVGGGESGDDAGEKDAPSDFS